MEFKFLKPSHINTTGFDSGLVIIHGNYGAGKTHLAGDACAYTLAKGGTFTYLNITGEDGQDSAWRPEFEPHKDWFMDLTEYGGIKEFISYYGQPANKRDLVVVDSLKALHRIVEHKQTGGAHPPQSRGWGDSDFSWIYLWMDNIMSDFRRTGKVVLFLCPSDLGRDRIQDNEKQVVDMEKKVTLPDLPGKLASGSPGWADFMFYLEAEYDPRTKKRVRKVLSSASPKIIARQRLRKEIKDAIVIPEDGGGWGAILAAINQTYQ